VHVLTPNPAALPRADGKYFVTLSEQADEASLEELHGKVITNAAKYMQQRLHLAERHKAGGLLG
jgi:hypothetical protein